MFAIAAFKSGSVCVLIYAKKKKKEIFFDEFVSFFGLLGSIL
jgi:uncharacterized membrane protein